MIRIPLRGRWVLGLALVLVFAGRVVADPVPGFVEEWTSGVASWAGGTPASNPATGGTLGAADGYLLLANTGPGPFGTRAMGAEYAGDWIAAGILSLRVSLQDVGADDPLEVHFSIGTPLNLWQANLAMDPPVGSWQEYVIDLTSSGGFTQVRGTGTFEEALRGVDRIHFRHDLAPFSDTPEAIQADVGLDHLVLSSVNVPALATTWGRIKALYRAGAPPREPRGSLGSRR